MATTSFKVQCAELTQKKEMWLVQRINEYAKIYNIASQYIPSLPEKYLKSENPSELYTKWIKGNDSSQMLQSPILTGLQMLNALKDACSNYKTRRALKQKKSSISFIKIPNIIKFENSEYQILKINDRTYAIHVGGKEGITIPLITNAPEKEAIRKVKGIEWGLIDHLNLGIKMQVAKKERNKELALKKRKTPTANKEKGVKAGLGAIVYNLRDNTVSIPHTFETPRFKKKNTRCTFIGVDRGVRNSVVLSAIFVDTAKLNGIQEYQELFNEPSISKHMFRSLRGLNVNVVGVKIIKSSTTNDKKRQIRNIGDKRREKRKYVGNRYRNVSETVSHQISAEAVKFISQFRNPVVFFEDLNMDKKKRRHKFGKKNAKGSRRMLSRWDYGAIRRKIEYKLEAYGIWTMGINPMFTSQTCNNCGAIGIRDGIGFKCERCGLGIGSNPVGTIGQYNADVNASTNIALKGLFALYGQKVGVVADPYEQPDRSVMKPIPTAMSDMDGKDTQEIEKLPDETNVSRSNLRQEGVSLVLPFAEKHCQNAQPMVEIHQVGCAPENGFSSSYKGKDNYAGRTELEEKTNIGEVVSQTEF